LKNKKYRGGHPERVKNLGVPAELQALSVFGRTPFLF
jgi:hypothetical protein